MLHALRNKNSRHIRAVCKSSLPNTGYPFRDDQSGKSHTTVKHIFAYLVHCFRQSHIHQPPTAVKNIISYSHTFCVGIKSHAYQLLALKKCCGANFVYAGGQCYAPDIIAALESAFSNRDHSLKIYIANLPAFTESIITDFFHAFRYGYTVNVTFAKSVAAYTCHAIFDNDFLNAAYIIIPWTV